VDKQRIYYRRLQTERMRDNLQIAMRITEMIFNRTMTKLARYNYSKRR